MFWTKEKDRLRFECKICESQMGSKSWVSRFINYYKCDLCNSVQATPFPTSDELEKLYIDSWSSHESAETGGVHEDLAPFYVDNLEKNFDLGKRTILDFGAGQGRLCKELKNRSYRFYAYEPFGESLVDNRQAYFRDLDEIPAKCDLVLMFDVIEHLRNPIEEINLLFDIFGSELKIFISTPNPRSFNAILRGAKWREANKAGHIIFFCDRSARHLASKIGCEFIPVKPWGIFRGSGVYKIFYKIAEHFGFGGATRFILTNRN